MKTTSWKAVTVCGWLAYAVLGLMLGLPLLEWLLRTGLNPVLVAFGLVLCAGWLLRHPLVLLGLWLGL